MEMVVGLVIYLAIGWYVRTKLDVDTEDALLNALITLFWPAVFILAIFVFMLWW